MGISITGSSGYSYQPLQQAQERLRRTFQHLASGKRIATAADDAAGAAIAARLQAQEASLDQGAQNVEDGQGLVDTAEGALASTHEDLSRMRELAVQAQNGTLSAADRATIQQEYDQLSASIDQTARGTSFGGQQLLDGSQTGGTAITDGQGNSTPIRIGDQSAGGLGVGGLQVGNPATVQALDHAIDGVSQTRAALGATHNAFDREIASQRNVAESLAASRSRIEDADFAYEMAARSRDETQRDLSLLTAAHGRADRARLVEGMA